MFEAPDGRFYFRPNEFFGPVYELGDDKKAAEFRKEWFDSASWKSFRKLPLSLGQTMLALGGLAGAVSLTAF